MKQPFFKVLIQWGLGILLILLVIYLGDISQLPRLPEIHWIYVFALFLSNLGFALSHNFRWKGIVDQGSATKEGNFFSLFRNLVNSYALGIIIPLDISLLSMRSYHLKQVQKMPMTVAIFSVLLDRLLDFIILIMMVLPSILLITGTISVTQSFFILALLLAGQVLIMLWEKGNTFHSLLSLYRVFLERWLTKIPLFRNWMKAGIKEMEGSYQFDTASVFQITSWSFVKYIFLSLRFYFTGQVLGIPFSWGQGFFFIPFIQLTGLINITPGGIGVTEIGTYGALFLMGVPKSQILIFVFGQRILLLFVFLILFALNHLFYLIQSRWEKVEGFGWK